jgi:mannose-6-phosphate isomerase-like protein (cupin superfamily)
MSQVVIAKMDRTTTLEPGQRVYQVLTGDETSSNFLMVWRRLPVGYPLGKYHHHKKADNLIIVLEGVLEAVVGGERYLVHSDEVIYMPAGIPHATANGGETEVQALEIYAPSRGQGEGNDSYPDELPEELRDGEPIRV